MLTGDDTSWLWATGLIAFAFGIVAGAIVTALLTAGRGRRSEQLQQELDRLQKELDDYREQVAQHFLRTSELVQQMTQSYRDVYEHLASGSEQLCRSGVETPKLDIPGRAGLPEAPAPETGERVPPADFSDAETDSLQVPDLDEFLGEAPRVPGFEEAPPADKQPST
ncbi:MAG TPA: DUF1043 family protein [Gammaproteobacteria bacterium]|nr:DUF1043 family protein [Gammaproteobacteria bacterium]